MRRQRVAGWALGLAAGLGLGLPAGAQTSPKVVGVGVSEGGSQIKSEVLGECIAQLPSLSDLQPVTDAKSAYVTYINGDPEHNASVRQYSATIDATYVVKQKKLVVVTTSSVERSEPVLQEVEGTFDRSIRFESNPENGDAYGGQGLVRQYYFSTEQAAVDDATRRAKAWINQKKSVMCGR